MLKQFLTKLNGNIEMKRDSQFNEWDEILFQCFWNKYMLNK